MRTATAFFIVDSIVQFLLGNVEKAFLLAIFAVVFALLTIANEIRAKQ